jgi:hypothetical protein
MKTAIFHKMLMKLWVKLENFRISAVLVLVHYLMYSYLN